MDRIRTLLKEKSFKDIDIRRYDFYLSKKEQDEWDKRNILYNTLWFYLNKSNKYPEVEYSDTVIDIYKFLSPFKDWEIVYHGYGKVFDPPKYKHTGKRGRFCADIMTGWWNPFKICVGLSCRKNITNELLNEIPQNDDYKKWLNDKIIKAFPHEDLKNSRNLRENIPELVEKITSFLEVVYTIGNIIPAPINWLSGSSLDSWDNKVTIIKKNLNSNLPVKDGGSNIGDWYRYIEEEYNNSFDEFLKDNDLYFSEKIITIKKTISFFGKDINESFSNVTIEEWIKFFTNAKEFIDGRNDAIQKRYNEEIKKPKGDE